MDRFSGSPTHYPDAPLHLREPFLDHVKASARPEAFDGLDFSRPTIDERQHVIITKFDVEPMKRGERDWVPCVLCGDHPKFLHGALIWSPHDGFTRLVGHRCASKEEHFGRRYAEMEEGYKARRLAEEATAKLRARLPQIPDLIDGLMAAEEHYASLQDSMRTLQRSAPDVRFRLQEQVRKNGGWLSVYRKRSSALSGGPSGLTTSGGGSSDSYRADVSVLRGVEFLDLHFRPHDDLVRIIGLLDIGIFSGGARVDLAKASDAFIEKLSPDERTKMAVLIERTSKAIRDLARRAADAANFLSRDNAGAIRRWIEDPDFGERRIDFEVRQTGMKIQEWGEVKTCLLPYMPTLPDLGPLP